VSIHCRPRGLGAKDRSTDLQVGANGPSPLVLAASDLVIEMSIEAFTHCQIVGEKKCAIEHSSHAHAMSYSTTIGYSPFTTANYRDSFDQGKLMEVLKRTK
jgi:hypothetical protein